MQRLGMCWRTTKSCSLTRAQKMRKLMAGARTSQEELRRQQVIWCQMAWFKIPTSLWELEQVLQPSVPQLTHLKNGRNN